MAFQMIPFAWQGDFKVTSKQAFLITYHHHITNYTITIYLFEKDIDIIWKSANCIFIYQNPTLSFSLP
jgi:hypothetical protein